MEKKHYISPEIKVFALDLEELLNQAPQSFGAVTDGSGGSPSSDDLFDIDNSGGGDGGWDDTDETL